MIGSGGYGKNDYCRRADPGLGRGFIDSAVPTPFGPMQGSVRGCCCPSLTGDGGRSGHCLDRGVGSDAERDRAAEAVTRFNVAMIHRAEGEFGGAVAELELVVELDRQVSHPDLQSDIEMLDRVGGELGSSDPGRGSR